MQRMRLGDRQADRGSWPCDGNNPKPRTRRSEGPWPTMDGATGLTDAPAERGNESSCRCIARNDTDRRSSRRGAYRPRATWLTDSLDEKLERVLRMLTAAPSPTNKCS